ncbi:MAG TPA: SusD/RagB family nutrient-binding outer membrane lipoprotein, partial [Flavisolibacter sp.]|nr:SusD/RagB family nutrient-binding outer membrane lipoprotein [Flavisolibacter sp.]
MKKIAAFLFLGVMVIGTSCKKYLDINKDPNRAVSATPQLILPQALTATANNLNNFNSYGAQIVGYMANAGGYGGFGTRITYNYSANDYSGNWSSSYDILEDYQTILNQTEGKPEMSYFDAAARIMKAHTYQMLVDAYNDVPYTEALKGGDNLTPAYTDAKTIYKDLVAQLDQAIETINTGNSTAGVTPLGNSDVMFKGDMDMWKKFANTLKLRILIHGNGKVDFGSTSFTSDGFLTQDALINPGYTRDNGRQNPKWNTWGFSYTGSDANKAWMPNTFIFSFYNGQKLTDPYRGKAIYYKYPNTGTNRLGVEGTGIESSPSGSFWYPSSNRNGQTAGNSTGVLKGPETGMPVITAAESYFLQSEGVVRGILTSGDAGVLFNKGIVASFRYLYTLPDGSISGNPDADAAQYMSDNSSSRLVNFSLATTLDQKIEAIITQKYIALNMVNSDEAWNEYRRTHYPTILNTASANGVQTFASSVSESTRPDKLPTRILYPTSEGSYNSANVP